MSGFRESRSGDAIQRVTVFRTGFLGDTVCSIPAFRLLRRHYAAAHLTLLCDRASTGTQASDIVPSLGIFDEIVEYQAGARGVAMEIARYARTHRPSVVVILNQRNETLARYWKKAWLFRLLGVETVLSVPPSRRPSVVINEPTRLVHGLNRIGIAGDKPAYDILPDPDAANAVQRALAGIGVDAAKPYIVFCGGGKAPVQRWELARYGAVLSEIYENLRIPVVAIGGEGELQECRAEVLPRFPDLRLLPESLPFRALCELMRSAFMYFGNDTGPVHVAAAVGCPTAVVMSSRNTLGAWDPDAHPALVIRHPTPCQGCFLVECTTHAHRCMTEITPRRVSADVQTFARRLAGVRQPQPISASGGL